MGEILEERDCLGIIVFAYRQSVLLFPPSLTPPASHTFSLPSLVHHTQVRPSLWKTWDQEEAVHALRSDWCPVSLTRGKKTTTCMRTNRPSPLTSPHTWPDNKHQLHRLSQRFRHLATRQALGWHATAAAVKTGAGRLSCHCLTSGWPRTQG